MVIYLGVKTKNFRFRKRMNKSLFSVLILLLFYTCEPSPALPIAQLDEIKSLKTDDQKRAYLEGIYEADQKVRNTEKEVSIIGQYGYRSDQHMTYIEDQWRQDEQNIVKIESYLAEYGHPEFISLGEVATKTPWLVIHHSADADLRLKYFGTLYSAYLRKNIDYSALALYLESTYRMLHDEEIRIEYPYTTNDRIEFLINQLNLTQEKVEVEKRLVLLNE